MPKRMPLHTHPEGLISRTYAPPTRSIEANLEKGSTGAPRSRAGSSFHRHQSAHSSEVLLAPYELEARLAVHVALDVQLAAEHFGSAEEHPRFGWRVDLADPPEHRVPVWPPKVRGGAQAGDGILVRIGVVDHDVGCIVRFDLGSQILGKTQR